MAYEMSAYRDLILPQLREMNDVAELRDTIGVFENLSPLAPEYVTPDSLICEFVGNGQLSIDINRGTAAKTIKSRRVQ